MFRHFALLLTVALLTSALSGCCFGPRGGWHGGDHSHYGSHY